MLGHAGRGGGERFNSHGQALLPDKLGRARGIFIQIVVASRRSSEMEYKLMATDVPQLRRG